MMTRACFVLAAIFALFSVSACSEGLRVLVYNNSDYAVAFRFNSDRHEFARDLAIGGETIFPYGDVRLPAEIIISTPDCEYSYVVAAPYGNYGEFVPSPSDEGPHRIELQIEKDFRIFMVPTGAELPLPRDRLVEQPPPYFPLKPHAQSC